MEQPRRQAPLACAPFHTWVFPDGTLWTEFYRVDGGYLLRFPQLADFQVAADAGMVTGFPVPGVSTGTAQHLYLNQVLPLALSQRGQQVYHASAVEVGEGAIVLAGESGRGKSTLAASFAVNGFRFLTDDGLVLERGAEGYAVLPSHPSIRLWADSADALIQPGAETAPAVCYTPKARFLAGAQVPFCDRARPLRRVYFLGDGSAETVTIEPLRPAEALVAWVQHSFLLDVEAQPRLASHFDQVASLAELPIHYRLDYPRRYDALAEVHAAILDKRGGGVG